MAQTNYDTTRGGFYPPKFNGKEEQWPVYKKKMESYLARDSCITLVKEEVGKDALKPDDYVPSATEKDEVERIQALNKKAAGVVLNSIEVETDAGMHAFYVVDKYHDIDKGYAGGHFYDKWEALKKRYGWVNAEKLQDLKEAYYAKKMKKDEQPSLFVTDLDRIRTKLLKHKHMIRDVDFIDDELSRLPKSNDPDKMTPYQMERKMIEEERKRAVRNNATAYSVNELVLALDVVTLEVYEAHMDKLLSTKR
jgi:hypothetical protein